MTKRKGLAYVALFAVSALLLVLITVMVVKDNQYFRTSRHKKYTLYIGLSDGVTGQQVATLEDAKKILYDVAGKYVDGYTVYEAEGFWREGAVMSTEKTLVCVIIDSEREAVKNLMDDALKAFKQRSILVEEGRVFSSFYEGKK